MGHANRYSLTEGMNRGGSVLLVAVKNEEQAEHFSTVLIEAGAIDLDELEKEWRDKGWKGFDGEVVKAKKPARRQLPGHAPKVRIF